MQKGIVETYEFDCHRLILGDCSRRGWAKDLLRLTFDFMVTTKREDENFSTYRSLRLNLYFDENAICYEDARYIGDKDLSLLELSCDEEDLNTFISSIFTHKQFLHLLSQDPSPYQPRNQSEFDYFENKRRLLEQSCVKPTSVFREVLHKHRLPSLFQA